MVTLHDGVPVVKVIDFGVAKALRQQLTDKTLFTGFAQMVGTPLYMSPEQAQFSGLDIDTRSDIYSLGVLLYELLAGVTPFDKERLRTADYDEMRRIIWEEDPPTPSTRLSTLGQAAVMISAERQSDSERLCRLLRGELDWIVMKALDKDRNRRYETANELARDIDRYLRDEPVLACPPSAWYRFGKFTRRHKAGLRVAAAAALLSLLVGAGVTWALLDQAARRRELSGRRVETEQTVSAVLIKTQQLRKQAGEAPSATSQEADAAVAVWRQAEASLDQAETALRTGTADARLHQRVKDQRRQTAQQRAQAQRTAKLLHDLDEARMARSSWVETHFDDAGAITKYAAACAAYGLELTPGRTEELARRIRAEQPAIREALIVALDNWQASSLAVQKMELAKMVEAIATAADDDPWRQQFRVAATARDRAALRALSGQAQRLPLPPSSLVLLSSQLLLQGDVDEALALLRWARGRHLTDFWIHFALGRALYDVKDKSPAILEETIGCCRTALALRPNTSAAHVSLGLALRANGQLEEAIVEHRKAIELDPKLAMAHDNLGHTLRAKGQLDEAIAEYRKAIEVDPKFVNAHNNLGYELHSKNQLDAAIAEYRKAIELDPKFAHAHHNLAHALLGKGQLEEAIGECQKAIELDPKLALAYSMLGNCLHAKNQLDAAIAEYRKAIKLDSTYAQPHFYLGIAMWSKNQLEEGIAEIRNAIELEPKLAEAYYNLDNPLLAKNRLDEAVAESRKAIELDPKFAAAKPVANAERVARLEAKLADVLEGKARPTDNGERLDLADVCRLTRRYVAGARLYADAFAADPKLADALKSSHRYHAACIAALAASGQGTDKKKLDDQEHRRLREQALAWLRADLEQWAKRPEAGKPEDRQIMRAALEHWQRDFDLASVRGAAALKKLSAQEQESWRKLWADVADLLKKAGNAK
jgi:tetratricopeptide (TPR) repeat protein